MFCQKLGSFTAQIVKTLKLCVLFGGKVPQNVHVDTENAILTKFKKFSRKNLDKILPTKNKTEGKNCRKFLKKTSKSSSRDVKRSFDYPAGNVQR